MKIENNNNEKIQQTLDQNIGERVQIVSSTGMVFNTYGTLLRNEDMFRIDVGDFAISFTPADVKKIYIKKDTGYTLSIYF